MEEGGREGGREEGKEGGREGGREGEGEGGKRKNENDIPCMYACSLCQSP